MKNIITMFFLLFTIVVMSQNNYDQDSIQFELSDFQQGNQHFMLYNNYEKAIECYDRYISGDSAWVNYALFYRGECKSALGNDIGAIVDFNSSLKYDTTNIDVYFERGNSKLDLGDRWGAINDYSIAIKLNYKKLELAYYNRSVAYLENNEFEKCISDLNSAILLVPSNGKYYYVRGNIYYVMGQDELACKNLSKAGELGYYKAYEDIQEKCK